MELVALVDLDGTLADFDGQMARDLATLQAPEETYTLEYGKPLPQHIQARRFLIRSQPGWWRSLPSLADGFHIVDILREHGFRLMVLSKGPYNTTNAWTEKVDWCHDRIPDAQITLSEDKGLVYGKVLVDDWIPYAERWLEWRPRGLVIMPDRPWNQGFSHPNVFRYHGTHDDEALAIRLKGILGNQ